MSDQRPTTIGAFINRYNELKRLYFSPKSDPQYDEDGQEVPSCFMSKSQIVTAFQNELKVRMPLGPQDSPVLLDGTRLMPEKRNQPAPPTIMRDPSGAPVVDIPEALPEPLVQVRPKAKMVHCSTHGKSLAIMMEDDILMCENCFKTTSLTEEKYETDVMGGRD